MDEQWRSVGGYEGLYEVSDYGNVRRNGRNLKPTDRGGGYLCVNLSKNNAPRLIFVHTLVLDAFVGPRPAGHEACHFPDRSPSNNRLSNLRWGTKSANALDRTAHGTGRDARGEKHHLAKLTESCVREAQEMCATGFTQTEVAARFGVTPSAISRAVRGKRWKHLQNPRQSE